MERERRFAYMRVSLRSAIAIGIVACGMLYVLFKLPYRSRAIPPLKSIASMTLDVSDGEWVDIEIAEEKWSPVLSATRRRGVLASRIEEPSLALWPIASIQIRDVHGEVRHLVIDRYDGAACLTVWGRRLELYDCYRLETSPELFSILASDSSGISD